MIVDQQLNIIKTVITKAILEEFLFELLDTNTCDKILYEVRLALLDILPGVTIESMRVGSGKSIDCVIIIPGIDTITINIKV